MTAQRLQNSMAFFLERYTEEDKKGFVAPVPPLHIALRRLPEFAETVVAQIVLHRRGQTVHRRGQTVLHARFYPHHRRLDAVVRHVQRQDEDDGCRCQNDHEDVELIDLKERGGRATAARLGELEVERDEPEFGVEADQRFWEHRTAHQPDRSEQLECDERVNDQSAEGTVLTKMNFRERFLLKKNGLVSGRYS